MENPVIIRPSFKKICNNDAYRAALFNQLLYSIACKVVSGGDYWYGTLEEIHLSLDESWCLSKVRKELEALINQGIIGQKHNEVKKWDRTMQYFFSKEEAKKLKEICKKLDIDLSSIGLSSQVTHLLNITDAFVKYNSSNCQKQQIDMVKTTNPSVKNNRAIPKVTPKVTKQKVTPKVTKDSAANAVNKQTASSSPLKPVEKPEQPQLPMPENTNLTQEEQAVYDEWCKMKWFKGNTPPLQKNDQEHLRKLAPYKPTADIMYKVKNWAMSPEVDRKGWYKKVGWSLYGLAKELPRWLSIQPNEPTISNQDPKPEDDETTKTVIWSKAPRRKQAEAFDHWYLYERMTIAEARQYGWDDDYAPLTPSLSNQIENKLQRLAAGEISIPENANLAVA